MNNPFVPLEKRTGMSNCNVEVPINIEAAARFMINRFKLDLLGAFRFESPAGQRIEIASRKGMALVATLAMARDAEHTRGWLQEKLWGTREPEQARSSLRRELSNLRRCLNAGKEQLLVCEHDRVRLDLRYIDVDARAVLEGNGHDRAAKSIAPGEFLEGFDIPGEDSFEDWLREQRSTLARFQEASPDGLDPQNAVGPDRQVPQVAQTGPPRVGICVLPFTNMSGDLDHDYFIDGVTEDIITDLSKLSALSVVPRNTARALQGKRLDVATIGRQLRVSYVLEGSVRMAGSCVRISAQLIECARDRQLWAERYDRDLSDIFKVQDGISRAIVQALRLTLLPEEEKALESHYEIVESF